MLPPNLDPTTWMELSPTMWGEVLNLTGESERLKAGSFDLGAFWSTLHERQPGPALEDALKCIHQLGTDDGRELIVQAAKDQNYALELSDDVPSRALAADLWLRSRRQGGDQLARVLLLAGVVAEQVSRPRSSFEFVGSRPLTAKLDRAKLEEAVIAWSKANRRHEAVEVFIYSREDVYFCEVVRGDPMKRVVEIRDGHRSILDFRPAVSDHIRYEPATGRISIATRSQRLRGTYQRLLGSMLAGDEAFFSDSSVCNLRPLQEHGAALFAQRLSSVILRVHVTELRWQRGDRDRLAVYGKDCFKVLEDLGARLSEGAVTEAKLRIYFVGDPPRADVVLRVPNRIEISGSGFRDEVIRHLLSEVGIRGSAPGSFAAIDTWSLFPYRHHLGLWRQRLGLRCDASVVTGTLRAVTLDSVANPDSPLGTPELEVEQLPDDERLGVNLDPPALRTLTATDYSGYELNWELVARRIAHAAGLSGPVRPVESWLWQVGRRGLASVQVNVLMAFRLPPAEAALVVKQHAGGARAVLIVPHDCTCRPDIAPLVKVDPFASSFTDVLPRVVIQLDLQNEVPARFWRAEELVLDTTTGRAWFGDQELLSLAKQPFDFAVLVARGRGQVVPKNLLNDKLSPSRPDDGTAKQAKAAFLKAVKASYETAGVPWPAKFPDIFPSQGGGYLLNCSAYVHPA